ncbi:MAG: hypothetical protein WB762_33670 [Candidatus Sulfotelmatobacter sp.]
MLNSRQVIRTILFCLLLLFAVARVPLAAAQTQNFTLSASSFSPPAGVDPGGTATAVITVGTPDNYTGSVAMTCAVTSSGSATILPLCQVSPSDVTPAATPSLTVTTLGAPAGTYTVTVTGNSTASDTETATLFLNIVSVPQDYTLTVSKAISPGTVSAGFGAQATVTVTPISSYTGSVTLSCLSITPPVTAAPFCSFNPATVDVTGSGAPTSILTVSTFGVVPNQTKLTRPRIFYALWLAIPGMALAGIGASGGRRRKLLGLLLLMVVASGLLLLPSCGSSNVPTTSNNANNLVTPKNTYTVTLTGVDQNGISPSNITSTSTAATVSLTVN